MEQIKVRVKGGNLVASASRDSAYPGIDVEYVPDVDEGDQASAPRVLFEYPEDGELHALVWTDKDKEDYTHKLGFTLDETVVNKSPIEIVKKMVRDEYNAFMEKMLRQSPKDIFDNAKKVDVYSELQGYILDMLGEDYKPQEVVPLIKLDNILDSLYRTYLDNDNLHCNTYGDTAQIISELLDLLAIEE